MGLGLLYTSPRMTGIIAPPIYLNDFACINSFDTWIEGNNWKLGADAVGLI